MGTCFQFTQSWICPFQKCVAIVQFLQASTNVSRRQWKLRLSLLLLPHPVCISLFIFTLKWSYLPLAGGVDALMNRLLSCGKWKFRVCLSSSVLMLFTQSITLHPYCHLQSVWISHPNIFLELASKCPFLISFLHLFCLLPNYWSSPLYLINITKYAYQIFFLLVFLCCWLALKINGVATKSLVSILYSSCVNVVFFLYCNSRIPTRRASCCALHHICLHRS